VLGGIAVLAAAVAVLAGHLPDASPTSAIALTWVYGLVLVGGLLCAAGRLWEGVALAGVTALVAATFPAGGSAWWEFLGRGSWAPVTYMAAAGLVVATVAGLVRLVLDQVDIDRPEPVGAGAFAALLALAVTLVLVGVPLGQLPFSEKLENGHAWPRFSPWKVQGTPGSFITSWASWNYSGYEAKPNYREYHDIVRTMEQVGQDEGCGRAFWEYEKELDRYGTPMALMLLPHWTDGCIGSMEGLYFEASATTPFHFLTQVELSTAPSAAQRDLPYGGFDITKGVQHLQMLGVKYYLATSDNAIGLARSNEDLTEIAASGPWVVFEVAGSELVTPLENEPAVVEGITDSQLDWVEEPHDESGRFGGPATRWFTDPGQWDVPLASGGPDEWQRVEVGERPEPRPADSVEVSNIDPDDERISFDVDEVGSPVLVKASYFPNWRVSGAEGPYRVAPNMMVVVPTERHVELTYGRTGVEWLSYALTLAGLVGLVLLARRPLARFTGIEGAAAAAGDPYRGYEGPAHDGGYGGYDDDVVGSAIGRDVPGEPADEEGDEGGDDPPGALATSAGAGVPSGEGAPGAVAAVPDEEAGDHVPGDHVPDDGGRCGDPPGAVVPGDDAGQPDGDPADTAPNDTAPGDTAPNDTAPNDTAPNDTAPGDTVPAERHDPDR
jgi:hypothetical protein